MRAFLVQGMLALLFLATNSDAWIPNNRAARFSSTFLQTQRSNHLWEYVSTENSIYALRHGRSQANEAGIIASDPAMACQTYGLTETGFQQAALAGTQLSKMVPTQQEIVLLSSDLKRAKETAETVRNTLISLGFSNVGPVILEERLRERFFGEWDGTNDSNYKNVWKDDKLDASHTLHSVESVDSVMNRATACVVEWDAKYHGAHLVFVAHGDVLQILQTAFLKRDGRYHRSVEHLETAQLRPLVLAETASP